MSAGGLSYHGIVGYGKATLPSVDSWGTNMSILRDPPKMIMTRRKDKVGETSSITQMCDDSGDRACEAINVYARGVNPMVAVSYQNYGNNGGQKVNGFSSGRGSNRGQQARKPYALGPNGQFRPPVQPPQSLLPLSRLPRVWTSSFTQPGFADYSKKAVCYSEDDCIKGVIDKGDMLRTCVRPTATYQIETPIVENFEVKYVIKNPTNISANSGIRTLDGTEQHVGIPTKAIDQQPLHADAWANLGSGATVRYVDSNHMNPERYLQDTLHSDVQSKMSQNIQIIPITDVMDVNIRTKEQFNIPYAAPPKGREQHEVEHGLQDLQRRVPAHAAETNYNQNIYVKPVDGYQMQQRHNRPIAHGATNHRSTRQQVDNISSRQYNLTPTINAGGFTGRGTMPTQNRESNITQHETYQQQINRKVMDMQAGRYSR